MWKKEDRVEDLANVLPSPAPQRSTAAPPAPARADRATIGRSITVRGDVTGDEDLEIQGRIEGTIDLRQHSVTVGPDGEVTASITGRVVTVEGRVEGNIDGSEQVVLRSSAFVKGDITAPRVVLENGARFRGLVDMGEGDEIPGVRPRNDLRKAESDEPRRDSAEVTGRPNGAANGKSAKPAEVEAKLAI